MLDFRGGDAVLNFLQNNDLARLSESGVITPDHTIRTKNWPLVLPAPEPGKLEAFAQAAAEAAANFAATLSPLFRTPQHARRQDQARARSAAARGDGAGLGLFGLGRSKRDAAIAADIAEAWIEGVVDAEAIGRFELISEAEMFDCEYWPLEQAKLGARQEPPLAGQVAAVTGAAGAIGAATAKAFAAAGAEVALLDVDLSAATEARAASAPRRCRCAAT